jgi:hypothetical protein
MLACYARPLVDVYEMPLDGVERRRMLHKTTKMSGQFVSIVEIVKTVAYGSTSSTKTADIARTSSMFSPGGGAL